MLYDREILWFSRQGAQWGRTTIAIVAVAMLAAVLIAGCGSGSSSSSDSSSASSASASEPSKEFNDPEGIKGIEPVATFGKESGESERQKASAVLAESLTARQEGDFATQCATLSKQTLETAFSHGEGAADAAKCVAELESVSTPLAKTESVRADTLEGEIAALRVKGNRAFALYHGNDGNDYAVPMEKEGGTWKVGSVVTLPLPKTPVKSPKTSKPSEAKKGG